MDFTRTTTINSAPGGDSTKQAVLDLDTDLTGAFGHLNTLDSTKLATATASTTYAPIAKGVTNGDTHDHVGGDGAAISLTAAVSGTLPVLNGGTGATASTGTGSVVLATSPTFTGTVTLPDTTSIGAVSGTEISYLDGVTSGIQTQINGKSPIAGPGSSQAFSVGALSATTGTFDGAVTATGTFFQKDGTDFISAFSGSYNSGNAFVRWNRAAASGEEIAMYTDGIRFLTDNLERVRINGSGNVLVGTTTDDGVNRLQVNGGISASALPVYADNTAAAALAAGTMYRTATGVVMIKY